MPVGLSAILNALSAAAAFGAALLWWRASTISVPPSREADESGWYSASIVADTPRGQQDHVATVLAGSRLNARAALFAGIAAALQAAAMILSAFGL